MNTNLPVTDVFVIGGGPAGSIAAGLLARRGHSVMLATRPENRRALAESLPPSCLRLFDRMGLASAVDDAGFLRSRGNTVWWGTDRPRLELFPGEETGLQVHRHQFDSVLLRLAERTGVVIARDAVVRNVELRSNDVASVGYDVDGCLHEAHSRWVLDCTGRAGVVARQVRQPEADRDTVALVGAWTRTGNWTVADDTHTIVESYADGWAWSVPVRKEFRFVTVMVDRTLTSLEREGELGTMYLAEIAKTRQMRDLIAAAQLAEPFWACGASPYGASQYVLESCLLVGDAASFIDPLSSYGVKKAMASAWVAAAAVHTALKQPAMAESAVQFFADREADVYRRFRDLTGEQYAAVANGRPHPFWTTRATGDPSDVVTSGEPDISALREDAGVLRAFEEIRLAPTIDLELAETVERIRRPGISVDEIVMEERLGCPWMPDGIRYLRGVDVLTLGDLAPLHRHVPDLYEDYNKHAVPVALPDLLGAISVMLAKGVLRFKDPQ